MSDSKFKYDIAYSFLAEDEAIAVAIDKHFKDDYNTFLYSKKQEELVGTDGEKTFNQVFNKESKIVVILYREKWGKTPWTRIEMTAIRNRALNEGYDFAILIPLDEPPVIPDWYPKFNIWFDFKRFDIAGAASIIKAKLDNSQITSSFLSAVNIAENIDKEIAFFKDRSVYLASSEARLQAIDLFKVLIANINTTIEQINKQKYLKIQFKETSGIEIELIRHPYSLRVVTRIPYSNSLSDSHLFVRLYQGAKIQSKQNYNFDTIDCETLTFIGPGSGKQIFSPSLLAEKITTDFMIKVQSHVKRRIKEKTLF